MLFAVTSKRLEYPNATLFDTVISMCDIMWHMEKLRADILTTTFDETT